MRLILMLLLCVGVCVCVTGGVRTLSKPASLQFYSITYQRPSNSGLFLQGHYCLFHMASPGGGELNRENEPGTGRRYSLKCMGWFRDGLADRECLHNSLFTMLRTVIPVLTIDYIPQHDFIVFRNRLFQRRLGTCAFLWICILLGSEKCGNIWNSVVFDFVKK